MTTPKCVLGVLSSGTLGGTEMTGGLDGFLLEVVLFSERKKKKKKLGIRKQDPTGLQGYQFHQKYMEQLQMLALESEVFYWFPEEFRF